MSAPQRIQRRRVKGWRMPANTVYVGHPTHWGNPHDWRQLGRAEAVTTGPCPALEFEGGRFWCGVVRRPSHYLSTPHFGDGTVCEVLGDLLGIGQGCDSSIEDPRYRLRETRA